MTRKTKDREQLKEQIQRAYKHSKELSSNSYESVTVTNEKEKMPFALIAVAK